MPAQTMASTLPRKMWSPILAALYATLVLGTALAAPPIQARHVAYSLEIPAQSLGDALQALALVSQHKLLYSSEIVNGHNAPAIEGEFTAEQALRKLLAGTDLTYEISDGFILIRSKEAEQAVRARSINALDYSPATAGAERVRPGPDGGSQPDSPSEIKPAADKSSGAIESPDLTDLPEILVTGTRIRGVSDIAAPTLTVTRENLETTGYSRLEDFFEDLPQNFAGFRPDGGYTAAASTLALQNRESSSAIDLRGLGPQSTLTLINGQRRAGSAFGRVVDLSAIPLSAVERIEIVTGGRSAMYGSDAVAGVVNIITRREFEGSETQVSYGMPTGHDGDRRLQLSQIAGFGSGRASLVAAYDYSHNDALDVVDTGLTYPARANGSQLLSMRAFPELERHAGLLSGRLALNDRVEIHGDSLYTEKTVESGDRTLNPGATLESYLSRNVSSRFGDFSGGIETRWAEWNIALGGSTSRAENEERIDSFYDFGGGFRFSNPLAQDTESATTTLTLRFEGPLFSLGRATPRLAVGAEQQKESFEREVVGGDHTDLDRRVVSVYTELLLPLSDDGRIGRLELSLAGRYDDYDDVGDTTNPQAGLLWEPTQGVKLRAAYSRAFRAPSLFDLGLRNFTYLDRVADPLSASGFSDVLVQSGTVTDLGPERATTWSAGVDFEPGFAPGLRLSLSYYDIDYKDRIEVPASNLAFLQEEERYVNLIDRTPTAQAIAAAVAADSDGAISSFTGSPFDPNAPGLIIFDNRTNNIAIERVNGLDFTADAKLETRGDTFNLGLNANLTLDHDRRVTATSPAATRIDQVGNPASLRLRFNAGWSRGALGLFAYLNHLDGYENSLTVPAGRVDSWTTLDVSLRYSLADSASAGWLRGLSAIVSVDNAFDADPPQVPLLDYGLRYDPANSNPAGRVISLRLTAGWL